MSRGSHSHPCFPRSLLFTMTAGMMIESIPLRRAGVLRSSQPLLIRGTESGTIGQYLRYLFHLMSLAHGASRDMREVCPTSAQHVSLSCVNHVSVHDWIVCKDQTGELGAGRCCLQTEKCSLEITESPTIAPRAITWQKWG